MGKVSIWKRGGGEPILITKVKSTEVYDGRVYVVDHEDDKTTLCPMDIIDHIVEQDVSND
jgi:hypothetical protein